MKIVNSSILMIILLLWFWNCQKDEVSFSKPESVVYNLKIDQQAPVYLMQEGGEVSFSLRTNAPLKIITPAWIHLEPTAEVTTTDNHSLKDSLYHYIYS